MADNPYGEIAQLIHRYADAVTHRNGVQWTSCWAPDAVWDLGGNLIEGREAIKTLWYGAMGGCKSTVQTVLNGGIDVSDDGTSATGRWYIQETILQPDDGRAIMLGHYDDGYGLIDGKWLFTRRFLQIHYMGPPDLSGKFFSTVEDMKARGVEGVDV